MLRAGRRLLISPIENDDVQAIFMLNITNAQLRGVTDQLGSFTLPGSFSAELQKQGKRTIQIHLPESGDDPVLGWLPLHVQCHCS